MTKKKLFCIPFRIWKTFLASDAPLELNVKNKEEIGHFIQFHKWGIISKSQALELFKSAETEVKIFLVIYIHSFLVTSI
jgi:hypothetical protein